MRLLANGNVEKLLRLSDRLLEEMFEPSHCEQSKARSARYRTELERIKKLDPRAWEIAALARSGRVRVEWS